MIAIFNAIVKGVVEELMMDEAIIITSPEKLQRHAVIKIDGEWYRYSFPVDFDGYQIIKWCKRHFESGKRMAGFQGNATAGIYAELGGRCRHVDVAGGFTLTVSQVHHYERWLAIEGLMTKIETSVRYRGVSYPSNGEWVYGSNWITVPWVSVEEGEFRQKALEHFKRPDVLQVAKNYYVKIGVLNAVKTG